MAVKAYQVALGVFGGMLFFVAVGVTACVGGCVIRTSSAVGQSMGAMAYEGGWDGWKDMHKVPMTGEVGHLAGKPLHVETGNGSIEIVKVAGTQVKVTAEVRSRDKARAEGAKLNVTRDGDGTLRVSVLWPDGKRKSEEGADLRIEIPDVSAMDLKTANGAIRAEGFSGKLVADTSNGTIDVREHDGAVHADTSNGAITLYNVGNVEADTSNGTIDVTLRDDATGPVSLDTSNGAILLKVGKAFKGTINADTSNGGVHADCPRATKVDVKKSSGSVQFGDGAESVVDTSNGAIEIGER
jgi:hypothetical protein